MGRVGALLATITTAGVLAVLPSPAAAAEAATAAPPYDVRGGDSFSVGTARCTIGFSVVGGYVTAGNCGLPGSATTGYNGVAQGTVQSSTYPSIGTAWVRVNSNWTPRGVVNTGGSLVTIRGARPAPVGATVCHKGATSGLHCGFITARNVTIHFPEGVLTGLIRTNICSEPRDQGAPLYAGDQAQGILIGGSGNCSVGGSSFYVPIATVLQRYGLTLVTG